MATPEEIYPTMKDSEIAGRESARAMAAGRFRLGYEFARIALRAHLYEQATQAQQIGEETPLHDATAGDMSFFAPVEESGPMPTSYPAAGRDVGVVDLAAVTAHLRAVPSECGHCGSVHDLQTGCPPRDYVARCVFNVSENGTVDPCNLAVWLHAGTRVWHHMEPGIQHVATVPASVHDRAVGIHQGSDQH
jgi:hypothetical protein